MSDQGREEYFGTAREACLEQVRRVSSETFTDDQRLSIARTYAILALADAILGSK